MGDIDIQIGPYHLTELLGEGGMGVVYRAEQREPVQREVALKLIRAGVGSDVLVRRFESERQALAVLEHPSIARVYDGGVTADGRPYFVMELVRGVPLLEYCDHHQLGLPDRIRLFAQVCRAIQHAHQKGVIHRDIKPSNILVTEADGEPLAKVIDFGIARATSFGEDVTRLTRADEVLGTPAYMSPEQRGSNQDVDTRTDVYSLGVVLYELFTGSLPFDGRDLFGSAAPFREPPTPSHRILRLGPAAGVPASCRRTDAGGLSRALRGDLDWIVMKALEKDRERRYETANALALDLERALANEPVLAHSPSTTYRMRKFVRRHAIGVASTAVIVLLTIGGVVLLAIQARRLADTRDEAIARRTQAEGLIDFMLGDLWQKLEPLGRLDILNDVGDRAVEYFSAVNPSLFSDAEIASYTTMLNNIGDVRMRQGNSVAATRAFEESLRLAQALAARTPEDAGNLYILGQSEFRVGQGYYKQALYDSAAVHWASYGDIWRRLVARDPSNDTWLQELGYSYTNMGALELILGHGARAAGDFRGALEVKEKVLAAAPEDPVLRYDVARAHYNLALALMLTGNLQEAQSALDTDIAIKQSLLGREPSNAVWLNTLVNSFFQRATLHNYLGYTGASVRDLDEADGIVEKLYWGDRTNRDWRRQQAMGAARRAEAQIEAGALATAGPLARLATSVLAELAGADTARLELRRDLAYAQRAAAALALQEGKPGQAEQFAAQAGALVADSARIGLPQWLLLGGAQARLLEGLALDQLGRADAARVRWREVGLLTAPLLAEGNDPAALAVAVEALLHLDQNAEAHRLIARLRETGYREAGFLRRLRDLGVSY